VGAAAAPVAVASVAAWPATPDFERLYFDRAPLVVRGGARHWPATHKWTSTYLRDKCGAAEVPVEVGGSSYLDPSMQRVEMPLSLYLDYLDGLGDDDAPPPSHRAYMAQARLPGLLDAPPSLIPSPSCGKTETSEDGRSAGSVGCDIEVPGVVASLGRGDAYARMVWLGPKGTVTPLHRDPYHNVLAQVKRRDVVDASCSVCLRFAMTRVREKVKGEVRKRADDFTVSSEVPVLFYTQVHGRKRLLLFPPAEEPSLYPSTDPLQTNSSQVCSSPPPLPPSFFGTPSISPRSLSRTGA
jgi:hypothetical protein